MIRYEFEIKRIDWEERLVGDTETNSAPTFVGSKIQQSFYYNNRLGFLTDDNVSMSQAGEFFNFYHISAQTVTDADPIDLNCSSIRPAALHGIIPVSSGLILFSANQQFVMYSAEGNLAPTTAIIRGISNYEMDTTIDPVDVGTTINFVSKTPGYTKVFGMTPGREGQIPIVRDVGKVVSEYIPNSVTHLLASPQNSLIALYGNNGDIYFYKTHTDGEEEIMQAWFKWKVPGTVHFLNIDADSVSCVTKIQNNYFILESNLSGTFNSNILLTNEGIGINPYLDLYHTPDNYEWDEPGQSLHL